MATIKVQNNSQKVLLDSELMGQFSDGYWENSRNTSWNVLDAVEVTDGETGVFFDSNIPYNYKGYSVNNKNLLEYVGDRMLIKARIANYLDLDDLSSAETMIEYVGEEALGYNKQVTKEDIATVISKWKMTGNEFWIKRAEDSLNFIKKVGSQNLVDAFNSNYSMKDMRKDLSQITKILKNPKVNA
jgi:hypothetical protein